MKRSTTGRKLLSIAAALILVFACSFCFADTIQYRTEAGHTVLLSVSAEEEIIIDDYDVPLGLGNTTDHVQGDLLRVILPFTTAVAGACYLLILLRDRKELQSLRKKYAQEGATLQ